MMMMVFSLLLGSLAFAGGSKDVDLTPTDEEKAQGWRFFTPIGFKLHRPSFFDTHGANVDVVTLGQEDKTPDELMYAAYTYGLWTDEMEEEFLAIKNDKNLSNEEKWEKINNELVPKIKLIYALVVLRTPLIKNQKLEEITGYPNNQVIRKTKEFTQIFATANFNSEGLSEKSAELYKMMLSQLDDVRPTIVCVDPVSAESIMMGLKNFTFDTIDLDGNKVTSDIFKDYDVTMINIWATWCPPCRGELPEIAKLYHNFKDKKCNIIGLVGDVSPEDQRALETAKALVAKNACDYTMVQNNDSFKPLFKGVKAWPTTIFVDKNGTIIAEDVNDIIVGSLSLEEFTEAMEKALKSVKK